MHPLNATSASPFAPALVLGEQVERGLYEENSLSSVDGSLDLVYAEAIMPNVDALARIFIERDVALVFYEIGGPDPATDRMAKEAARALGWGGGRVEVGRLTHTRAGT